MTSTRDRLQAHRFGAGRVRAALLEGDAESTERPLGRLGAATYAGILVTIALVAVVGLLGVLRPGNSTAWQQPGAFIVETRDRRPLRRSRRRAAAGAQLLVGKAAARRAAARGVGVRPVAGVGAARRRRSAFPARPTRCRTRRTSSDHPGRCAGSARPPGARPLRTAIVPGVAAAGDAAPAGRGLLLRTPSGRTHLLLDGRAFEIGAPWLEALGYQAAARAGRRRPRRRAARRAGDRADAAAGHRRARPAAARRRWSRCRSARCSPTGPTRTT